MSKLQGKVALVTGASKGIGAAIALELAAQGAAVAVNYSGSKAGAEKVVNEIKQAGGKAIVVQANVADPDSIGPLINTVVKQLGPIDILVNNAGTTWGAATVDHPLDAWQKVLNLNLTAMFLMSQEIGRRCMVPRCSGRIINIASILGLVGGGDPGRPATIAYNTSKGGVVNFTRSLAAEWAQYNINVNAIAPGFFPTKMTKGIMEMLGDAVADKAPLKRVGGPEDLKGVVALFASDAGSFITGQTLAVDGGVTII